MPKVTQSYTLWQMLTKDKDVHGHYLPVKVEDIVNKLGIKASSVPVYIFNLREDHDAEIENITEASEKKRGAKKIVGYRLTNDIVLDPYRANSIATSATSAHTNNKPHKDLKTRIQEDGEVPTLDVDTTYDDREILDIRSSLSVEIFDDI